MSTSLDMSLDDLIKSGSNRNSGRGQARGRGRARGQAGTSRGRSIGMLQRGPLRVNTRPSSYVIAKSFSRAKDLISRHDLFSESMVSAGLLGIESGIKLYISNLDYGVSNEDIKDLFSEIGSLKRCAVHYDRNGRPSGSAEVHFVRKSDAMAAMARYNNVQLDGKTMKIEIVGTNLGLPVTHVNPIGGPYGRGRTDIKNSSFGAMKVGQGGSGRSGRIPGFRRSSRGRGRDGTHGLSRGSGRGRWWNKRPASAEELDKDLETYHAVSS